MRSGDEPNHARSPLGLRLGLALFGLLTTAIATVLIAPVAPLPVVLVFAAVAVVAALDLLVVIRAIRLGPHYQPGPSVPPYRPVQPAPAPRRPTPPADERTRMRRYFAIMVPCVLLIVVAWTWVRTFSTTAAVIMSIIAAPLPPIAVIVANFGVRLPDDPHAASPAPTDPPPAPRSPPAPDPPSAPPPDDPPPAAI